MFKNNKNILKKILGILVGISISFTTFAGYNSINKNFEEERIPVPFGKEVIFPPILEKDFVRAYSEIILEIEKFGKIKSKEKTSLKELEKKKKELENEYKKNYKKLKNKEEIRSLEEIKKIFPEYIKLKKISQIRGKNYIKENYNKEDRKFFTIEFEYKIEKEYLKQADNIYLISGNNNIFIPKINNLYFSQFTSGKKYTMKGILENESFNLVQNIEKTEGKFLVKKFNENINRYGEENFSMDRKVYYIVLEKGNNIFTITSRSIFAGFPFSDDKKEFNKAKERFFNNLARNNYQKGDFYLPRFGNDKKLEDYMRLVLNKKIEKFETIEDKKEFLGKITKLLEKTLENTQTNVNNLMETFVSDEQINEISKKYNKIIKNKELFIIFIGIIKEEEKILDFKTLEKIIF